MNWKIPDTPNRIINVKNRDNKQKISRVRLAKKKQQRKPRQRYQDSNAVYFPFIFLIILCIRYTHPSRRIRLFLGGFIIILYITHLIQCIDNQHNQRQLKVVTKALYNWITHQKQGNHINTEPRNEFLYALKSSPVEI